MSGVAAVVVGIWLGSQANTPLSADVRGGSGGSWYLAWQLTTLSLQMSGVAAVVVGIWLGSQANEYNYFISSNGGYSAFLLVVLVVLIKSFLWIHLSKISTDSRLIS